ncbi:helix-turn-helix domain-containing protein [Parapedobacter koreensis]|uniref:AraC-type DNA-binding protein n=1 Tax=Parapedobacter koreensis TaxID=332977 RepID=A0A1H7RTC7_9SPHI|nr:AraC family transcriptional regulator [Parapedobacter koreensis]SEL63425.1 AraC-type DNA-binding protein [Parapedobacter koreensis]
MENYQKYLHISDIDREWGFYINTVGYCKTSKNMHYPDRSKHPRDHVFSWNKGRILDGYYIVFITGGSGIFESAKTAPQQIGAGTCFILFPGIWHRYKPDASVGWEEYWIGFNGEYPKTIMERFFSPDNPCIKTGLNKDLLAAFAQLLATVFHAQIGYPQLISGITLQIMALLKKVRTVEETDNDPESIWVSQTIFILQNQLATPVNMEKLAEQFPISYSKFRKSFKRLTGKSPNQYHLDLRLDKAEELLKSTNMTIKEIGYHTGFDSPYYFSRLFKAKFGLSPKVFRRQ